MKTRNLILLSLGLFCGALSAPGQGSFQNLGFESAHDIPVFDPTSHPWIMSAGDALPGWTCYLGTNQTSAAWYDDIALSSAAVGIQDSLSPWAPAGFISGQYCASLQYGYVFTGPSDYYFGPASIAQVGQIPSDAWSMRFNGTYPFAVTFAGHAIPLVIWATQSTYNVYAADVSQFAGQVGELRIASYYSAIGGSFIDAIQFSDQRVPEPGVLGLFAFGALLFGWPSLRRRR